MVLFGRVLMIQFSLLVAWAQINNKPYTVKPWNLFACKSFMNPFVLERQGHGPCNSSFVLPTSPSLSCWRALLDSISELNCRLRQLIVRGAARKGKALFRFETLNVVVGFDVGVCLYPEPTRKALDLTDDCLSAFVGPTIPFVLMLFISTRVKGTRTLISSKS